MSAVFYVIRHGVTRANKENRFAGRSEETLHGDGERQIRELARELQHLSIGSIYAGPLVRTRQSAQIISRKCSIPFEVEEDLTDIDLPHWDGLTKDEIREQFGQQYPAWLQAPGEFQVDGCETLAQVQKRAVQAMARIRSRQENGNVLLVTHLIVARCLILHEAGIPLSQFRSVKVSNGAVVRLAGVQTDLVHRAAV